MKQLNGLVGIEPSLPVILRLDVADVEEAVAADAEVDEAVRLWPQMETFLQQDVHDVTTPEQAYAQLSAIMSPPAVAQKKAAR